MEPTNLIIKKVADYSMRPGPRLNEQGNHSGEDFYNKCLKSWFEEALQSSVKLRVILDGTDGYLSSFLDESFGRLVYDFGEETVKNNIEIVSNNAPHLREKIYSWTLPRWTLRRKEQLAPQTTTSKH